MTETVYCAGCNEQLQRKSSDIERNRSGLFYCSKCRAARFRGNGTMPQQRGWQRPQKMEA